jgi:amino acid transporter
VASSEAAAGPVRTGGGESTHLFIRQTSGLVRELGIPAATAISLASVAVVNTFINFNAGLTDFPKADMYLPLVAAAVIWLVAMFAYRYLLIVAALSLFRVKIVARIIFWLIVLQLVAFVALIGILAFNSHASFVTAFGSFSNHPGAYQAMITAGHANGVVYGTAIASAVAIIPFMVLNYNGVLYSYYVGGELRRPGRTYLYASTISIVVLVILWVGVWALLRARAGLTFMQAQANVGLNNATGYAKITSLSSVSGGLGYGLVLSNDPITKILFATAVPFAEIAVNLAFVTVTTRVLFAQAFDRLLPVSVAKIGDKNHAPNVAIGIVLVIGSAFCLLISLVNLGSIVALQSLFMTLVLLAGGVAALFLPLRRPDLIELPGASDDARKAFLRKAAWVGGATTVLALFTVFELVTHSSVYGKFSWESIVTLVIVLGAGPVIYAIARSVRRQRDALDLSLAMHELPPE